MTKEPKVVHPNDEIAVVDELFRQHRIHHLPVVEDNKLIGIVSKSDFLYLLRGYTHNEVDRFREMALKRAFKVRDIMHERVESVSPDAPIKAVVSLLAENRFRAVPVVDAAGNVAGIVTTHDIIDMVDNWGKTNA
jgi:CBS domain-containing protein